MHRALCRLWLEHELRKEKLTDNQLDNIVNYVSYLDLLPTSILRQRATDRILKELNDIIEQTDLVTIDRIQNLNNFLKKLWSITTSNHELIDNRIQHVKQRLHQDHQLISNSYHRCCRVLSLNPNNLKDLEPTDIDNALSVLIIQKDITKLRMLCIHSETELTTTHRNLINRYWDGSLIALLEELESSIPDENDSLSNTISGVYRLPSYDLRKRPKLDTGAPFTIAKPGKPG